MLGCEVLFDDETASGIHAEIRARRGVHPCEEGQRCPLLPNPVLPQLRAER